MTEAMDPRLDLPRITSAHVPGPLACCAMRRPITKRGWLGGSVLALAVAVLLAGCGGSGTESDAGSGTATSDAPLAVEGDRLSGVQFEVRKDPG